MKTNPLNLHCSNNLTVQDGLGRRSQREADLDEDMPNVETDDEDMFTNVDFRTQFTPLHLVSVWVEPVTMIDRITISVVLPSGVDPKAVTSKIVNDGRILKISMRWPEALANIQRMHKKWLSAVGEEKMLSYHPEIVGFQKAIKPFRSRVGDSVRSTSQISLPFAVESHIGSENVSFLAWRDGSEKMLHLRLRAAVDDYALKSESNKFEIV